AGDRVWTASRPAGSDEWGVPSQVQFDFEATSGAARNPLLASIGDGEALLVFDVSLSGGDYEIGVFHTTSVAGVFPKAALLDNSIADRMDSVSLASNGKDRALLVGLVPGSMG